MPKIKQIESGPSYRGAPPTRYAPAGALGRVSAAGASYLEAASKELAATGKEIQAKQEKALRDRHVFEAQKALLDEQTFFTQALHDMKVNAEPGAPGFAQQVTSLIQERAAGLEERFAGFHEDAQQLIIEGYTRLGNQYLQAGLTHEDAAYTQQQEVEIDDRENALLNSIIADPSPENVRDRVRDGMEFLGNAKFLDPERRSERTSAFSEKAHNAAFEGLVTRALARPEPRLSELDGLLHDLTKDGSVWQQRMDPANFERAMTKLTRARVEVLERQKAQAAAAAQGRDFKLDGLVALAAETGNWDLVHRPEVMGVLSPRGQQFVQLNAQAAAIAQAFDGASADEVAELQAGFRKAVSQPGAVLGGNERVAAMLLRNLRTAADRAHEKADQELDDRLRLYQLNGVHDEAALEQLISQLPEEEQADARTKKKAVAAVAGLNGGKYDESAREDVATWVAELRARARAARDPAAAQAALQAEQQFMEFDQKRVQNLVERPADTLLAKSPTVRETFSRYAEDPTPENWNAYKASQTAEYRRRTGRSDEPLQRFPEPVRNQIYEALESKAEVEDVRDALAKVRATVGPAAYDELMREPEIQKRVRPEHWMALSFGGNAATLHHVEDGIRAAQLPPADLEKALPDGTRPADIEAAAKSATVDLRLTYPQSVDKVHMVKGAEQVIAGALLSGKAQSVTDAEEIARKVIESRIKAATVNGKKFRIPAGVDQATVEAGMAELLEQETQTLPMKIPDGATPIPLRPEAREDYVRTVFRDGKPVTTLDDRGVILQTPEGYAAMKPDGSEPHFWTWEELQDMARKRKARIYREQALRDARRRDAGGVQ